jgi:hypothetical protein
VVVVVVVVSRVVLKKGEWKITKGAHVDLITIIDKTL